MQSQVLPNHVGLILDGNRRWAKSKGLPTLKGHAAGYNNLLKVSKYAINGGVKYVSAYIFSTENWDRTKTEVNYLMSLALKMISKDLDELHQENIKIVWLGSSATKINDRLKIAIKNAEEKTKNNTKGTLCLCFDYGGRQEIVDAVKKVIKKGTSKVSIKALSENLYHPEVPDIDLLIRTSGEKRLSGFMLWRAAYAELYFSPKHWPDFKEKELDEAIDDYNKRDRRFGK